MWLDRASNARLCSATNNALYVYTDSSARGTGFRPRRTSIGEQLGLTMATLAINNACRLPDDIIYLVSTWKGTEIDGYRPYAAYIATLLVPRHPRQSTANVKECIYSYCTEVLLLGLAVFSRMSRVSTIRLFSMLWVLP